MVVKRYWHESVQWFSREARGRAVASDASFDGKLLPPALTTMILQNAVQATTLGVFVGFAGLPIARAEEPVPPSNTKLKRLLAEAMLDNAAFENLQPIPPYRKKTTAP